MQKCVQTDAFVKLKCRKPCFARVPFQMRKRIFCELRRWFLDARELHAGAEIVLFAAVSLLKVSLFQFLSARQLRLSVVASQCFVKPSDARLHFFNKAYVAPKSLKARVIAAFNISPGGSVNFLREPWSNATG